MGSGTIEDTGVYVGAARKSDGTLDLSHALRVAQPEAAKIQEGIKDLNEKRDAERKAQLEIPSDVKKGTSRAVFWTLNQAILQNEWAAEDAGQVNNWNTAVSKEKKAKGLKLEQKILSSLDQFIEEKIKFGRVLDEEERWDVKLRPEAKPLSDEEISEAKRDFPASEAAEVLAQTRIEQYDKAKFENKNMVRVEPFSNNYEYTKDALEAANSLRGKLEAEGQR